MSSNYDVISLFHGAGGIDLGFEQAGFRTVLAYDIFESAINTHNANRSNKVARFGDVSQLSGAQIAQNVTRTFSDAQPVGVIGGPPCQAFSRSNVYPRRDDFRRTLPGQFARILHELGDFFPLQFFLFENVQGITFKRHQEEFERFRFLFEEAGFYLYEALLNAKNFGVPQDRPRVFIVGIAKNIIDSGGDDFLFPKPREQLHTVENAFEAAFGQKPWPEPAFFRRDLTPEEIQVHPNHWTMMPKSPKFHNGMLKEGEVKGRSFRVLAWDKPSWTVAYGNREIHVHPSGKRRLSIFEAMLLQGFPRDYVLKGTLSDQVKLVSDAVPPPLAHEIARSLKTYLTVQSSVSQPS